MIQKHKLIYLLRTLSTRELKAFGQFLSGSGIKRKPHVQTLYAYLLERLPRLNPTDFDKKEAFRQMYPEKKEYISWLMREVMSNMCQVLEDFLVLQHLEKHRNKRAQLLLDVFQERKQDTLFFRFTEHYQNDLKRSPERGTFYHYEQLQVHHKVYFHPNSSKNAQKQLGQRLQEIDQHLDQFYLLAKLRYGAEMLARQRVLGEQLSFNLLEECLQFTQRDTFANHPLLGIYRQAIHLLKIPTAHGYQQLKPRVFDHIELGRHDEQVNLLILLINLAGFSLSAEQVLKEYFDLYKIGLEREILIEGGYMTVADFNNIIYVTSALGEFDWAESFIDNYVSYLPQDFDIRRNITRLFKAFLHFGKKDYDEVIRLLARLEFEDFTYGMRANTLLLQSYYEAYKKHSGRFIDARCDSYKVYLHRKLHSQYISRYMYDGQVNFIRFVKRLPNCSASSFALVSKDVLQVELNETLNIACRNWLMQKVKAIN